MSTSTSTGTIKLLFFASLSTHCANMESLHLAAPITLTQLVADLESMYPGVSKVLRTCQVVRNLEYVDVDLWEVVDGVSDGKGRGRVGEDVVFETGDEVGLVPPVSSG